MDSLTLVLMAWNGSRATVYTEPRIAALAAQLREHIKRPFRLVLLTDFVMDPKHLEGVDEILPCPPQPMGDAGINRSPVNCTRRLRLFDPAYAATFGTDWVASMDIDMLVLDDITDIVEYALTAPTGMTILRGRYTDAEAGNPRPYNGALWFLRVGAYAHVWQDWNPVESPKAISASGWIGSDQVWMSLKIEGAQTIGPEHGVYYLGQYERLSVSDAEPRVINYAGMAKPWSRMAKRRTPELYDYYCDYDPTAER